MRACTRVNASRPGLAFRPRRGRCIGIAGPNPRSGMGGEGIVVRHRRGCGPPASASCFCRPGYQAQACSPARETDDPKDLPLALGGPRLAPGHQWRQASDAARPTRTTLARVRRRRARSRQGGVVRTRSGEPYKPSALRSYEQVMARWRFELAGPREGTGGPLLRLAVELDVHELVVEGDPVPNRLHLALRLGVGPGDVVALA